jgi:outer membrane lipoprotein-sorting protein
VLRFCLCAWLGVAGFQGAVLPGAELPAWWRAFPGLPRLETAFVQESQSAVFGKLSRQGRLRMAKGGKLRVEYQHGLLLVSDGRTLTQYDPAARTAQRLSLKSAVGETPLLNILLNPGSLSAFYDAKAGPGLSVALEPLQPGLPRVVLTGEDGLPRRIQWTDATGASQVIQFQDARIPAAGFAADVFNFKAPDGTRWLSQR